MKDELVRKNVTSVVGTLDKNDEDEFIVRIETKESVEEINFINILNDLLGRQIKLYSEEDILWLLQEMSEKQMTN